MGKSDIMRHDYNQQFDHLIKELTKDLCTFYMTEVAKRLPIQKNVDTSPLLNMTLSVFMSSLINVLDFIKSSTIAEVQLMQNIELTKEAITKAILDLPFIKNMEQL